MMERFVILKLKPEYCEQFLSLFNEKQNQIASFPGCTYLELQKSKLNVGWYMTYSIWKNEEALEVYRHSTLFTEVWSVVKNLFAEKADALSITEENEQGKKLKETFINKFHGYGI
jgi:heme-degrading monooxygenase HmoA